MIDNFKISISGELGSGKSLQSKLLSEKLKCELISIGKIQRQLAEKHGMSTLDFNKYIESHPEIDIECDNMIVNYGHFLSPIIVDSRLAWHFIPDSFKIHLIIDQDIAAKRIFTDKGRTSEIYIDINEAREKICLRKSSEKNRYLKLYNIDIDDFKNYNLIIDTSVISPEGLCSLILTEFDIWLRNGKSQNLKVYLSPKNIFPTQNIREHSLRYVTPVVESMKKFGYDEHFPIEILRLDNEVFIYNGHKRCIAAIINRISLIPVKVYNLYSEEFPNGQKAFDYLADNYSLKIVFDWETINNFKFSHYYEIAKA